MSKEEKKPKKKDKDPRHARTVSLSSVSQLIRPKVPKKGITSPEVVPPPAVSIALSVQNQQLLQDLKEIKEMYHALNKEQANLALKIQNLMDLDRQHRQQITKGRQTEQRPIVIVLDDMDKFIEHYLQSKRQ
jgi:hypothetical protein